MYCKNCGENIDDRAVVCPHCGVPTESTASRTVATNYSDKYNTMSIVGFVLAFFFALVGLICSIIGRKQCKETGEKGMGLATAGIIISIIGLVGTFISIIMYIVTLFALVA